MLLIIIYTRSEKKSIPFIAERKVFLILKLSRPHHGFPCFKSIFIALCMQKSNIKLDNTHSPHFSFLGRLILTNPQRNTEIIKNG